MLLTKQFVLVNTFEMESMLKENDKRLYKKFICIDGSLYRLYSYMGRVLFISYQNK